MNRLPENGELDMDQAGSGVLVSTGARVLERLAEQGESIRGMQRDIARLSEIIKDHAQEQRDQAKAIADLLRAQAQREGQWSGIVRIALTISGLIPIISAIVLAAVWLAEHVRI